MPTPSELRERFNSRPLGHQLIAAAGIVLPFVLLIGGWWHALGEYLITLVVFVLLMRFGLWPRPKARGRT